MSADNQICVQKRLDGKYWVWMHFVSDEQSEPTLADARFDTYELANAYAQGWRRGESIVECGIVILSDQGLEETPLETQEKLKCPWCKKRVKVEVTKTTQVEVKPV